MTTKNVAVEMTLLWKSQNDFHRSLEISLENARFPHSHKPIPFFERRRTYNEPPSEWITFRAAYWSTFRAALPRALLLRRIISCAGTQGATDRARIKVGATSLREGQSAWRRGMQYSSDGLQYSSNGSRTHRNVR